jgi:hypothetical protein
MESEMPRAPEFIPCAVSADTRRYYADQERNEALYDAAYSMSHDFFLAAVQVGDDMTMPRTGLIGGDYPLSSYLAECSDPAARAHLLKACSFAMQDKPGQCWQALQEFVRTCAAEYAGDAS